MTQHHQAGGAAAPQPVVLHSLTHYCRARGAASGGGPALLNSNDSWARVAAPEGGPALVDFQATIANAERGVPPIPAGGPVL